jgi:hypothetical protein
MPQEILTMKYRYAPLTLACLVAALNLAADWPQFLGPQRNSTSTETGLLQTWDAKGPPLLWQKIVFLIGDHGRGLPRSKRWVYNQGTHVPLIVRWPGHIKPDTVRDDRIIDLSRRLASYLRGGIEPPCFRSFCLVFSAYCCWPEQ